MKIKKESRHYLTEKIMKRAITATKNGAFEEYVACNTSARTAKSRKYTPGEVVVNIDPKNGYKKPFGECEFFVGSINWSGGGGYILMNKKGKLHSTTNIKKVGEARTLVDPSGLFTYL
jgi:hypothetical protein